MKYFYTCNQCFTQPASEKIVLTVDEKLYRDSQGGNMLRKSN